MVGIHGIGGIGKTTLAQVVYNSIVDQFDGSCYLEDVRGNHEKKGLIHLQNTLLSEIFGENQVVVTSYNKGIKELRVRLKQKKVLLLLDNVDKLDQLRAIVGEPGWFGCGSRVIITTRDTEVLRNHGVQRTHEVEILNEDEAYNFLRWKTFKTNEVSPRFEDVFNRALTYTSGLPLAIEIIGSHLFSKTIEEWKSALDQYEKIPKQEIFKILKVSFDDLVQDDKEVFLDIACFFKGFQLGKVEEILHAHYDDERKNNIKVLIEKSLIKIGWNNVLTLHDLIEDMGKEIVRLESPYQLGERSRLWSVKDIAEVLEGNTGTSKIGIMMCSDSDDDIEVKWDGEAFKNMTKLRTLVIGSVSFSESPKHLPNSLRVMHLWKYPSEECLPVDFFPRQLTICKLNCAFNCQQEVFFKKYFKNMRILRFEFCDSLRSIPDISGLQNLEELSCFWCHGLITFDGSIGMLGKLQILNVKHCSKLQTIPSLKLPSLEKLDLSFLYSIKSLSPMLDESLDKLKILKVEYCSKLQTIPSLKLASLEKLTLYYLYIIESLSPMLDESLDRLKILKVEYCSKLQTIPSLKLPSLEELYLKDLSSIESLSPMLDESLDKLKILKVESCKNLIYIPLLKLASLEKLTLSYLSSIESISPMLDESLSKLKILKVINCAKLQTIPSLKLASLEELYLLELHSIKSLSPLLDESLDNLKVLNIQGCYELWSFPPVMLPSLEELDLSYSECLESFPRKVGRSMAKLKILRLKGCKKLRKIPAINVASLDVFDHSGCDSLEFSTSD